MLEDNDMTMEESEQDIEFTEVDCVGPEIWEVAQEIREREAQTKSKPEKKKPAKKPTELGKGMTTEQMIEKRDGLKAETKQWTEAIDRRRRAERAERLRKEREKEQRDAVEFYRKYKHFMEFVLSKEITWGQNGKGTIYQYVIEFKDFNEGEETAD